MAGTFLELLQPPVSRKDYDAIARILALTNEQARAGEMLFDGYMAAYKPEADRLKQLYDRLQRAANEKAADVDALRLAYLTARSSFWRKKDFAQRSLLMDIKAVLSDKQRRDAWPKVERLIRRKLLPRVYARTATTWNLVDVVACVEAAEIPPESLTRITPLIEEYETDVDRQLIRYEQVYWSRTGAWSDPSEDDLTRIGEEVGQVISPLNKRYAQWVADLLAAEVKDRFLMMARQRAYPAIAVILHRESVQREVRRRIDLLSGLDEESRSQIDDAYGRWDGEVKAASRWMIAEYDQADAEIRAMTAQAWADCLAAEDKNPCNRIPNDVSARCDDISKQLTDALRRVLNETQREVVWPPAKNGQQPGQ
jgi:hypothetical protein